MCADVTIGTQLDARANIAIGTDPAIRPDIGAAFDTGEGTDFRTSVYERIPRYASGGVHARRGEPRRVKESRRNSPGCVWFTADNGVDCRGNGMREFSANNHRAGPGTTQGC